MSNFSPPRRIAGAGFTLIELMVTVAVVAILATIALSSYQTQVLKSRRTDARSALLDLAGREEKLFSTTNAYSALASDLGYAAPGTNFPITIGSGYYTVTVQVPNPNSAVTPSYLITATAIGTEAKDTPCATLSVDQTGLQSSTGGATAATCWGN